MKNCSDCAKENLSQRLKKRITILKQTNETNNYNERLDEWIEVATCWAAIEPIRGREFFSAGAEHAEVTTRIRIRYREGIDRTMIARFKNHEFEILHIIHPNFEYKELQLMCKERQ